MYRVFLLNCLLVIFFLSLSTQANVIEPTMVQIPSGSFSMGSDEADYEKPKHTVRVETFYLSKYEVTVKEFSKFIKATGYKTWDSCVWWKNKKPTPFGAADGSWKSPTFAPSQFHPVMCVSWDDAQAYISWLSKETGKKYRLPSESEWEYAARAGSNTQYFYGNDGDALCRYGNIYDRSGKEKLNQDFGIDFKAANCDDFAELTTVVGMYEPNDFGIYDTIGNVGELVEDCEHPNYHGAPNDGSAWISDCKLMYGYGVKMRRGASYGAYSSPKNVRTSRRAHTGQVNPSALGEGFRIALDLKQSGAGNITNESNHEFIRELARAQENELERRKGLKVKFDRN
jgi:formylglycine-generating enzyme required for sulfatase activity